MLSNVMSLLLLGASQTPPAPTPQAVESTPPPLSFHLQIQLDKDKRPIPFEYSDNHVIFQTEIGGQRVWMLLDNGSEHSAIDIGLANRLGLAITTLPGMLHTSGGHDLPRRLVDDVAVVIPGAFSVRMPMIAIDLKKASPSARQIQAVLGHDITGHFIVVVNKQSGELLLVPGTATFKGSVTPIPIKTVNGRDQVDATVNGQSLTLTLDTGSFGGINLTPAAWARVAPKNAQVFQRRETGFAGIPDTELASLLPTVSLGTTMVHDVDVRIGPELSSDGDGRIGMGLLSRYSFVLDAQHGQLWLVPVATDTSKLPPPVK